jgi:hypothetical protein
MRYIPIEKLRDIMDSAKLNEWEERARQHLEIIRGLNQQERTAYYTRNNIWMDLYPYLSELSHGKCWYSEAPENSNEWDIDHFRPKSKAHDLDRVVNRDDGYWWLTYYWKNYRLAGSLVNLRRKDRFEAGDEVFGKGTFFPLDKTAGIVAEPENLMCNCEVHLLLDPAKVFDVTLIAFDENGEPFPSYSDEENEWLHKRAVISIDYYGLKHTPLNRGRKKIWDNCMSIINETYEQLKIPADDSYNKLLKQHCIENCYQEIMKMSQATEPYSMVVKSFVEIQSKDEEYKWLANVKHVLG